MSYLINRNIKKVKRIISKNWKQSKMHSKTIKINQKVHQKTKITKLKMAKANKL
jgi:hypothetical protein